MFATTFAFVVAPVIFAAFIVAALAIFPACSSAPSTPSTPSTPDTAEADKRFGQLVRNFFADHLTFRPSLGVDLGLHEYDGKVPERSRIAIDGEVTRLKMALETFERVDASKLGKQKRIEREVVLAEIRKELFELDVRRRPYRDPFFYLFKFSLNAYIARDYAPIEKRAIAMLSACEAAPRYYQQAAANLDEKLPKAYLQVGMMMAKGQIGFLSGDAKRAFAQLPDAALKAKLETCLDALAKTVSSFGGTLEARMPKGTDEFRLGGETLVAMLKATDGIETTIATLEKIAKADLEKNRAALIAAAKEIDPSRDVAAVVAEASNDKPTPDAVIGEASAQLVTLRKFLVEKQIVSLPREDVVEARESPAFMRGNFAALGGVGPFEAGNLPSFYYIAPPDKAWPADVQKAYVMSRADLLFTSAHEVYPGHFVQGMHQRASGSRVIAAFETYTASEGWAHYVEQMMWDEGLGNRDPRIHIGQLKNALLRDVRFLVALGYHAGNMTPDEATKLFMEQAFADPANAKQQAMRGTIDPMFLGYTLGKLVIQELRADWHKANPTKSLREFHDEFLSYGEAPLPATRRMMLGDSAAAPLHD